MTPVSPRPSRPAKRAARKDHHEGSDEEVSDEPMTNSEVAEELDAYGGHLPAYIEGADGELYELDRITTYNRSEGVAVVLVAGERVQ
jgi:hypothetical protein